MNLSLWPTRLNSYTNIYKSDAVVSIIPESERFLDEKFAVELGIALMLDKPMIGLVRPGTVISKKLSSVFDRFVEWNDDPDVVANGIKEALRELNGVGS